MSQSTLAASFIGRVLADRYRLEAVLGTGGMGAVYKAHDQKSDSELAIKVLHHLGPGTEDFHQRFFNEALIAGQLFHPNSGPDEASRREIAIPDRAWSLIWSAEKSGI